MYHQHLVECMLVDKTLNELFGWVSIMIHMKRLQYLIDKLYIALTMTRGKRRTRIVAHWYSLTDMLSALFSLNKQPSWENVTVATAPQSGQPHHDNRAGQPRGNCISQQQVVDSTNADSNAGYFNAAANGDGGNINWPSRERRFYGARLWVGADWWKDYCTECLKLV